MEKMFCYQCEQTARGAGCTMTGVCGKNPEAAHLQDALTCEMVGLARAVREKGDAACADLICDGLFTTVTNVNFDVDRLATLIEEVKAKRESLGGELPLSAQELFHGDDDAVSLRATLLFGLRGMAAYAHHARVLGKRSDAVDDWLIKGMASLGDTRSVDAWLGLLMEFGGINLAS